MKRVGLLEIFVLVIFASLAACQGAPAGPVGEHPAASSVTPALTSSTTPTAAPSPTPASVANTPSQHSDHGGSENEYSTGYSTGGQSPSSSVITPPDNSAYFVDNLATADGIVAYVDSLTPPPSGQEYQGWLVTASGALINTGALKFEPDGDALVEWVSPDGKNLFIDIVGYRVSLETARSSAPRPTGKIILAGQLTDDQVTLSRQIFVTNTGEPATPRQKALAIGLIDQFDLAAQHAIAALNAKKIGADAEMRLHLEHAINILEGTKGARNKDYDGNGSADTPGDGFGVLAYAQTLAEKLNDPALSSAVSNLETAIIELESQTAAVIEKHTDAISADELLLKYQAVHSNEVAAIYLLTKLIFAIPLQSAP